MLVTRDEQEGIAIDRALDTNILVVTVLKFTLYNQSETLEPEQKGNFLELLNRTPSWTALIGGRDGNRST